MRQAATGDAPASSPAPDTSNQAAREIASRSIRQNSATASGFFAATARGEEKVTARSIRRRQAAQRVGCGKKTGLRKPCLRRRSTTSLRNTGKPEIDRGNHDTKARVADASSRFQLLVRKAAPCHNRAGMRGTGVDEASYSGRVRERLRFCCQLIRKTQPAHDRRTQPI